MGNAASGALDTNAFKNAMSSVIVSNSSMSLPSPESITYGGMFNEHCFDVTSPIYSGEGGPVVCPLAEHALDWCGQRWLGVFLATSGDGSARACRSGRKIELAVCIDISGSMGDPFTPPTTEEELMHATSKMDAAKQAVLSLIDSASAEDSFALVTFNENANVLQDMTNVGSLSRDAICKLLEGIQPGGGTSLCSGFSKATSLFVGSRQPNVERRVIFLTDMCDSDPAQEVALFELLKEQAAIGVHISVIGLGVDFNADVTNRITRVKGANYFCVFSLEEFCKTLSQEFVFNFFPIAFDVQLRISAESSIVEIGDVFGNSFAEKKEGYRLQADKWSFATHRLFSEEVKTAVFCLLQGIHCNIIPPLPEKVLAKIVSYLAPSVTCEIHQITTMFASPVASMSTETRRIQGGLLLAQMNVHAGEGTSVVPMRVRVHFSDMNGTPCGAEILVAVGAPSPGEYYNGDAIHKGVLLCRYVEAVKAALSVPPGSLTSSHLHNLQVFRDKFDSEVALHWQDNEPMNDAVNRITMLTKAVAGRTDKPCCVQ